MSQASIAQLAVHGIIFRHVKDSFIQSPQILRRQLRSREELFHQLLIEASPGCAGMHKKPTSEPQQPTSWHCMIGAASIWEATRIFFCVLHCHGAGQNYITHMARQAAEWNPAQTRNFWTHSRNRRILDARSTCNWIDSDRSRSNWKVDGSSISNEKKPLTLSCPGFRWF